MTILAESMTPWSILCIHPYYTLWSHFKGENFTGQMNVKNSYLSEMICMSCMYYRWFCISTTFTWANFTCTVTWSLRHQQDSLVMELMRLSLFYWWLINVIIVCFVRLDYCYSTLMITNVDYRPRNCAAYKRLSD